MTNQFIERIVAAHVFERAHKLAIAAEKSRAMEPSGLIKRGLSTSAQLWESMKDRSPNTGTRQGAILAVADRSTRHPAEADGQRR